MNDLEQLPLKDIHLPDPVSWWPLAAGWWLVVLICIVTAGGICWWLRTNAPKRRIRKLRDLARSELARLEAEYAVSNDTCKLLQDVSILIRRMALSISPRRQVAGLCGQEWAHWLQCHGLDERSLELLLKGPYTRVATSDGLTLTRQCRQWLRHIEPVDIAP